MNIRDPKSLVEKIKGLRPERIAEVENFVDFLRADWKASGLLELSIVKPVVTTIEQTFVIRKLGRLNDATQSASRRVISSIVS